MGKSGQCMSQVLLGRIVAVRGAEPCRIIQRPVAVVTLKFVKNGVAHTTKEVSLLIAGPAEVTVLDQLQEDLM